MMKRGLIAAFLLLIVLGIAAPFIQADRYGQQIRDALQRELNRKVEIGQVHFNLFTGPGFTVENVVIYDDPSAGIEPFAHMLELERVSGSVPCSPAGWISLSSGLFLRASISSSRTSAHGTLFDSCKAPSPTRSLPEIQVSDGRIYLKTATRNRLSTSRARTLRSRPGAILCMSDSRESLHARTVGPGVRAVYCQRNDLRKQGRHRS